MTTSHAVEGRERILNEAYTLFTTLGFAEVSMQHIADAAGITKATMYHHFRNKEELFVQVCLREMRRIRDGIAAQSALPGSFRERLEGVVRFLLDTAAKHDMARLFSDLERHVSADYHQQLHAEVKHPGEVVGPLFEQAVADGEIRPIDLPTTVAMFFGMVMGQIKFAQHAGSPDHLERDLAPIIVDTLIDGIGKRQTGTGKRGTERS